MQQRTMLDLGGVRGVSLKDMKVSETFSHPELCSTCPQSVRSNMEELLRESDTDQDYDKCVRCGKITTYKKTDNIIFRSGYIEGAGQLCFECNHSRRLHRQGSYDL